MTPYGPAHLVMLAIFVAGVWPVIRLGRAQRAAGGPTRFSRAFALAIPAFTVPFQIVDLTKNFELGVTLPLQLCDLAWVAAALALWTHHPYFVSLTYFWGLVLTTQGIVTPSLSEDFPDPRFIAFWGLHLLIVWSALYLVWGLRRAPRWRDYGTTLATTLGWLVVVAGFNLVADTNYGYTQRKPGAGSILDYLGPWPWYIAAEIAIVAVVWALMTWPWARADARTREPFR